MTYHLYFYVTTLKHFKVLQHGFSRDYDMIRKNAEGKWIGPGNLYVFGFVNGLQHAKQWSRSPKHEH